VIPAHHLQNIPLNKALMLIGPQGSGKRQLARSIAQRHCSASKVLEASIADLTDQYRLHALLCKRPGVLIVDELPCTAEQMAIVKAIVSERTIEFWMKKTRRTASFPTPKIILISNDQASPYLPSATDRRFTVIDLGATVH
jgi:Holliday junction resolvasome RuvABC ATP-dependent DNA helicase subunit